MSGNGELTTIKRTHLTREVKAQLEEAIRRGDFKAGDRLPSERALMEAFGVSRVSVREAIRSLEALGRVSVIHGRGAFVTDRRSALGGSMIRWLEQHQDEVAELVNVRGALDVLAVEEAVERSAPELIEAVVAAQTAFAAAVEAGEEPQRLVDLDIDFHLRIAEASGNRLLYDLLTDLHMYLGETRIVGFSKPARSALSRAEHDAIVIALVTRDLAAAGAAMRRHLASSTGASSVRRSVSS